MFGFVWRRLGSFGDVWRPAMVSAAARVSTNICDVWMGSDLGVAVVDEDVPGAVVLQVGDLQTARVPDLGRLEGGVQGLNLHHCFGLPGLDEDTGNVRRLSFTHVPADLM